MLHLNWAFIPVRDALYLISPYSGKYQVGLVILSIVVAALAAFVALAISGRIVAANSRSARWAWASAGATAMGGGIWGMHFIGMLAFSLPCGVGYDPVGTVLSMIPGILASGVALHVISQRTDPGFKRLAVGAVLMGAGIGLMHYTGMAAMQPEALLRYDPGLVAVSIIVAVALAFVSLGIRFRFRTLDSSGVLAAVVAAPVMGLAVAGMHYTAMEASIFYPLADAPLANMAMSPMFLAALITVFIVLIMAITLVATFAGRQVELAQSLTLARKQAEDANLAKSQFLATMSHEIRTPMNGVLGTANLLATTPLNDRQTQLVHSLVRSGETLLGIISDILDLAKIEAGHFELDSVDFEPRELIAEVTDLFCQRCSSKGLEFVYFVAEDVPRHLTGDPARLRQVLINLVGNAMKFTEHGEILLEVSVAEEGEDHLTLACSVRDTGIGIAADQKSRIFDSFHQVDASTTRSRGGTGLGLSIVKELVGLMGGEVGVDSEVGRGSRFWFTVRLDRSRKAREPAPEPRSIARPLRVLVVDGNAVSAQVAARYCDSWKLDAVICRTAADGEAKWQEAIAAHRPFDVAIIDIKGLRCRGLKFARKIRADQRTRPAEVILLIALDGSIADAKLESVGAFALLAKPARPSVLFDCLASIASGARDKGVASFYVRKNAPKPQAHFDASVLVVEDNAVNQEVVTGVLENMGCHVIMAPNGLSAVQLFEQARYDLILMDCEMPVMDGFEAARRIRAIERSGVRGEQGSRVPIVAVTAHALAEVREKCLSAGMDDFLVKPFDELQMADVLGRWLTPHAATAAAAATVPAGDRPTSGSLPTIDIKAVDVIRAIQGKNGTPLLDRVVSQFTATAGPLLSTMRAKCADGDPEAVWRAAHSLKSSAAAIGACRVCERCAEIETMARERGILPAERLLAELDRELGAAMRDLHKLTGAPSGAA
ncbi:MAG TPA: MHYT domain-containing protein [Stellaceae bacterium]|nr:MHYT domain-containing protein [Stellaceae bacterium]